MSGVLAGSRIGNWYLEEEVSRGPQGILYRARSYQDDGRKAAVKVWEGVLARHPNLQQTFAADLLPLQRLEHSNIARYYEGGIRAGVVYIACEWVTGEDYARRLRQGPVPWQEVLQVAVQMVRALKHAHNRNILHRELKPAHVMRTEDGIVKVLSCGLARIIPPPVALTPSPLGAESFLPPEVSSGKPYTRRSDFYALGGVLYTLLTGRPPFPAATLVELTHKHSYVLPERPAMLVPDVPAELDEFVCLLLEKNPSRRPANAHQLLEELEHIRAKLERRGKRIHWPVPLTPDTVETVVLAQHTDSHDDAETQRQPRPLLQRAWVVIPAFLLVIGLLLYAFLRPQVPAEELYQAALPLMQSERPEDWEYAWEMYLEPLSRKYPDRYSGEVTAFRQKLRDYRELKRLIVEGSRWQPRSEAERAYWRGLRMAQTQDIAAARRIWKALIIVFESQPAERLWVELARQGLTLLDQHFPSYSGPADTSAVATQLQAVIERMRELRQTGHTAEAERIRRSLEDLYQNDTVVSEFLQKSLGN
jgi:serine/threonine protein kinase